MPLTSLVVTLGRVHRFSELPSHTKFICIADLERGRVPLLLKLAVDDDGYNAEYLRGTGGFCAIKSDDSVIVID
jgi:hypothetical protein